MFSEDLGNEMATSCMKSAIRLKCKSSEFSVLTGTAFYRSRLLYQNSFLLMVLLLDKVAT